MEQKEQKELKELKQEELSVELLKALVEAQMELTSAYYILSILDSRTRTSMPNVSKGKVIQINGLLYDMADKIHAAVSQVVDLFYQVDE